MIADSKARVFGSPVSTSRSASTRSSATIARLWDANQPMSAPMVMYVTPRVIVPVVRSSCEGMCELIKTPAT